jgi:hypothetical protein
MMTTVMGVGAAGHAIIEGSASASVPLLVSRSKGGAMGWRWRWILSLITSPNFLFFNNVNPTRQFLSLQPSKPDMTDWMEVPLL